jgi:hypothetical protein
LPLRTGAALPRRSFNLNAAAARAPNSPGRQRSAQSHGGSCVVASVRNFGRFPNLNENAGDRRKAGLRTIHSASAAYT